MNYCRNESDEMMENNMLNFSNMFGMQNNMNMFPENPSFGQSYVPIQIIGKVFRPEVGLKMGTIFPELVSPYEPGQSMREIEYLERFNNNQPVGGQM